MAADFATGCGVFTNDTSSEPDRNLHVASAIAARTTLPISLARMLMILVWSRLPFRSVRPRNQTDRPENSDNAIASLYGMDERQWGKTLTEILEQSESTHTRKGEGTLRWHRIRLTE